MAHELIVDLPGRPEPVHLRAAARLGRADSNDLVVDDPHVSGEHLEFRPTPDGWEVLDLDSTNGTFVDGERITRRALGPRNRIRLGPGPDVELTVAIPGWADAASTRVFETSGLVDRYLAEEEPADMSERTRVLRAHIREEREEQAQTHSLRTRRLRHAVAGLAVVAVLAASAALWQSRRVEAQREAAAELFYTIKELELDLRRLEAAAGPDDGARERHTRLEAQYEDLMATLGIYSDRTPPEVRLIYRTVHRLGESEVAVPREFVDEVLRYAQEWNEADLRAGFRRAEAGSLGPRVGRILLDHHLPREFFYLALQESKLDPEAIGPSTRFGVPKGMWQMIPGTAEAYGLTLGPLRGERAVDPSDERHDVAKATAAAARYLADLYETDAQASGLLVMAAYNMGETRLLRLVRSLPESPRDRNFWALMERHREEIPQETYDYVYRVVAAAVIGADPELFGYDFEPPLGATAAEADDG